MGGELSALVGIEDFRLATAQSKTQGIEAEGAIERAAIMAAYPFSRVWRITAIIAPTPWLSPRL